jgi:hypothetical protein
MLGGPLRAGHGWLGTVPVAKRALGLRAVIFWAERAVVSLMLGALVRAGGRRRGWISERRGRP